MYLTLEAIEATLATVAESAAGTRIVMTYDLPRSAHQGIAVELAPALSRITSEMGEPFVSLFEPAEAEQLLLRMGYLTTSRISARRRLSAPFTRTGPRSALAAASA
jgi:O-methyltransferase involved in polyketide biosynthesis